MTKSAKLIYNGKEIELPIFSGTENEDAIDISKIRSETGLITLEDLIEQIVGRLNEENDDLAIVVNDDGSVLVGGSVIVRDLNKHMSWNLHEDGAKTLSGLIVKHLDQIPTGNICVTLNDYKIETTQLEDNVVRQVKVSKII